VAAAPANFHNRRPSKDEGTSHPLGRGEGLSFKRPGQEGCEEDRKEGEDRGPADPQESDGVEKEEVAEGETKCP
jgi:hypothetical protein